MSRQRKKKAPDATLESPKLSSAASQTVAPGAAASCMDLLRPRAIRARETQNETEVPKTSSTQEARKHSKNPFRPLKGSDSGIACVGSLLLRLRNLKRGAPLPPSKSPESVRTHISRTHYAANFFKSAPCRSPIEVSHGDVCRRQQPDRGSGPCLIIRSLRTSIHRKSTPRNAELIRPAVAGSFSAREDSP